jgi:hypothetical protein
MGKCVLGSCSLKNGEALAHWRPFRDEKRNLLTILKNISN